MDIKQDFLTSFLKGFDLDKLVKKDYLLDSDEFLKVAKNRNFFILDVRHEKEYNFFHFPFAVNIPLDRLPDEFSNLPQNKVIVIIADTPVRSSFAYVFLLSKGFFKLKILSSNIKDVLVDLSLQDLISPL